MYGFLNIYKPKGLTSFDVIKEIRKLSGEHRVGHAGTLDPLAEGVLLVAMGKMTRLLEFVIAKDKTYQATLELGKTSDTFDSEGEISFTDKPPVPTEASIKTALQKFIGDIDQIPPAFSAIKIKGQKAYDLARKGESFTLAPRKVTIFSIQLLSYAYPLLQLEVYCGSGTYIRSLANDIGSELKIGAIITKLVRTKLHGESLKAEQAVHLEELTKENLEQHFLSAEQVQQLLDMPVYELEESVKQQFQNGVALPVEDLLKDSRYLCWCQGKIAGIGKSDATGSHLRPEKVLLQI